MNNAKPKSAATPAATTSVIDLDTLYKAVLEEMQAAEKDVQLKTLELANARERLAAVRGKMDMLGQMQQMGQQHAQQASGSA